MKGEETIYVMDIITPRPGRGEEVFRYYVENYVPLAQDRGLRLQHRWVSPPLWLQGNQSNTLYFVWSVTGVGEYWAVEAKARWDATAPDFWRDLEPMIVSRSRQVLAGEHDLASLGDV